MSPLFALLALAAQAAAPSPEPEAYRALGAAPFWGARIGDGRMVFETPGRDIIDVVAPERQQTEIGVAYWTPEFSLSIEYAECRDGLTGRTYADRVTVTVGEERFEGCGGEPRSAAILPSYSAAGGEPFWWLEVADGRITWQIDNRSIIAAAPAPLVTGDGRRRAWRTPELLVSVRRQDCELEDERTYADTVTVTAGGRTVTGCGGAVVRAAPDPASPQ